MNTEGHPVAFRAEDVSAGDRLPADRRELLRARLAGQRAASAATRPGAVPRRPADAPATLSFAQQRLWVLDRMAPGNPFYTESTALRLRAAIDPDLLERAINAIVERHEVLRTTLPEVDGRPVARLGQGVRIPLDLSDLSDLTPERQGEEVVRLATEAARRPFSLADGPLLRTSLVRLGPTEWVFLLSLHHIVCDGWSSAVFSHELSTIYADLAAGRSPSLPDLPIQYADYAHWQREWLAGERMERQLDYWRERLADLAPLELPADHRRPAVFSYAGSRRSFLLPRRLADALDRLGHEEGATLFMTLMAGFDCLLHRLTGQDDVAIGTPVAGRTRKELEPLIGFFVNSLVIRVDLSGRPSYREVLRRVRARALEAYDHQDLPFEKLVEDLQPERDLARNPLFQVIFQLHADQSAGADAGADAGLGVIEVERATVKFDLRLEFRQTPEGLAGAFEYSTDLFRPERIDRMVDYLVAIYEEMARAPDAPVSALPLVRGEERRRIADWGREGAPEPSDRGTIVERFLAVAAGREATVAVSDGERDLTYGGLRDAAAELARRLQARGCASETIVVVPSVRAAATVAAELAVLMAGGAYLPLDLDEPDERLRHMIATAGATLVVDTTGAGARLEGLGLVPVPLDAAAEEADAALATFPGGGDRLAYVMYTSGSTGLPKGVAVRQNAVLRLVENADYCAMGPDEAVLLLAPMTFDASTLEVWAPLLNGGRLVVHPPGRIDIDALADAIRRHRVTMLWLTAGLFHQIVDNRIEALAGLRQLLAGGDVLSPRHVRAFLERYPDCRLVNGYGPTENTTFTCCHRIAALADGPGSIPVGRPIGGGHVYVVDRDGHLAPEGVPGELWVAGEGLARGYLGDPAMTAEWFVPDPFNGRGARAYRTGDLVRFLPDGALEFLGRKDRQLKIRGHRVEPREIEMTLASHPDIADAAVIARDDLGTGLRLVAYVTPETGERGPGAASALGSVQAEAVGDWRTIYDDLYAGAASSAAERGFDTAGWRSSYTGQPIPAAEMRTWLDATLARIRSLAPTRVLEIGCGTGMLAYPLAAEAAFYRGVDFSAPVVEALRRGLRQCDLADRTEIAVCAAHEIGAPGAGAFDAVLLNSVVQYFPGAAYLRDVLDRVIPAAGPVGRIFIGDVRSLPHVAEFQTAVQLARNAGDFDRADFVRRVRDGVLCERELLVDPALFRSLAAVDPRVAACDIQWKRGDAENELAQFRYDVILHLGACETMAADRQALNWRRDGLSLESLARILRETDRAELSVTSAPNPRLAGFGQIWELAQQEGDSIPAATVSEILDATRNARLDAYWEVAESAGFEAAVSPSETDPLTCTLHYRRQGRPVPPPATAGRRACPDWAQFTNNPVNAALAAKLIPSLREHVAAHLPQFMHPADYVLLDALPLTRNGKVDRRALPSPLRERSAAASAELALPTNEVERRLAQVWAGVLGLDAVGIDDNFFELGGDSILGIQVVSRARAEGIGVTVQQLFESQTVAALAAVATLAATDEGDQRAVEGPCDLGPAQLWMFESDSPRHDHFNQALLLQVPAEIDAQSLDAAFRALLAHHDALRLRFRNDGGAWTADTGARTGGRLDWIDLSEYRGLARRRMLEAACADCQRAFDLRDGPLFAATLFDMGPGQPARLLLVAHHLVVDGVSWRILLEHLWLGYQQAVEGRRPVLPPKTTSFAAHAASLRGLAQSDELLDELPYWLSAAPKAATLLPVDRHGTNREGDAAEIMVELPEDVSRQVLTDLPRAFRTQINDVLLTAFARAMIRWSGLPEVVFDLEGHGRDPAPGTDLSRTVGWFTSIFPVTLRARPDDDVATSLRSVQAQLHEIPRGGAGFGVLRYLSMDPQVRRKLADLPPRDIGFNYMGQYGGGDEGAILAAPESVGPMREPRAPRRHLIEVEGAVAFGRLRFTWIYSRNQYDADSIREVADLMLEELRGVVAAAVSPGSDRLTAEDFPAARLDEADFTRLMARLGARPAARGAP